MNAIPPEFQGQLRPAKFTEPRADFEILESLRHYVPVTSEKNIWAFWHSGVEAMPAWCKHNVIGWVRICDGWTVRVLDSVSESPNNALRFIAPELLPDAFTKGLMDGDYSGPHSADLVRGPLLYLYGGVNIDVGCILIRHIDRICWNELADPNSPYQVAVPLMYGRTIANHFVAARKGDHFIKRWHDLFSYLWRDRTNSKGLIDDPLVAFGAQHSFEEAQKADFAWDFKVPPQTVMEYIAQILAWQRLCMLEDDGTGFNGTEYWENNVLCFDVLQENWGAEATIGFKDAGQTMFDLLALQWEPEKMETGDEQQKKAYQLVWRLLTQSSMQKITRGKNLTHDVHLGVLWDLPENEGKDCGIETWAEMLRYGTVHFEQTRESVRRKKAERAPVTFKKGLLEA